MGRGKDWSLTFRHGPKVEREQFSDLDAALAELERKIERTRAEGPLSSVKMFREYEPGRRVQARGEISRGGLFKSVTAGVDLMGDGTLVAFQGSVRRRLLDVEVGQSPYDVVRETLRASA